MVMIKLDDKVLFFSSVRGCFLTSSLIGTLALSLTIPLSILADICMQKVRFPRRWAHRSFSQKPKCRRCFYVDDKVSQITRVVSQQARFSWLFFVGAIPVFLSFFIATLLCHYNNWDPVLVGLRRLYAFVFRKHRVQRYEPQSFSTESFFFTLKSGFNVNSLW